MKTTKFLNLSIFLISFFMLSIFSLSPVSAQEAREGVATLDKEKHPAFEIIYTQPEKIVQEALLKKLKKAGLKTKNKKHLITAKGVIYTDFSNNKLDFYFQTKKKNKQTTLFTLFISKGYDNYVGAKYDSLIAQNALIYLKHFNSNVEYYALQLQLDAKQKDLKKAKSKYEKRKNEKKELLATLDKQTEILKSASGKEAKKAQKKIKRSNKQLGKRQRDINNLETEINGLETTISDLKKKQSEIHLW